MPATAPKQVKIAIDFPAPLFQATEQAVRELSTTRSALVRTAVELFLRSRQREKLECQIAESFSANSVLDRQLMDEFKHVDADLVSDAE
jgi:metal-responsive CopG/Arc/MetJ family transcriptional regulator